MGRRFSKLTNDELERIIRKDKQQASDFSERVKELLKEIKNG